MATGNISDPGDLGDQSERKDSISHIPEIDSSPTTRTPSLDICERRHLSVSSDRTLINTSLSYQNLASLRQPPPEGQESSSSSTYSIDKTKQATAAPEPVYHSFTRAQKKCLIYIVSAAALFSPLSSNIYFPALGQISNDLHVPIETLGLTVTIYMVVQGLAPSVWGTLADQIGRRQVFIGTFIVYLIANIGLGLTSNFVMLMVFRAIQAAGSAATISIGAGVIGDITTSKERGSLIGIFGGLRMMGQSIGPVFGGIISQYLGFRAIFWFLLILGFLSLLSIVIFLPETLRTVAGNGTVLLTGKYKPLIYCIRPQQPAQDLTPPRTVKPNVTLLSMVAPLRFLFEKDVFITLFFGAVVYAVWSMVTSSTTALLDQYFGLNDLQVGLCFLPNGAGCVSGSIITGYLMDWDYKKTEREYIVAKGLPADTQLNKKELLDFPIEKSRMRNAWWIVAIFIVTTALYGYSIPMHILALPLILQFFIAYTATALFSLNSALVIDLYPGASASATAVNNLMRCSVGAIGVGVVQYIIDAIGSGHTFLLFALLTLLFTPCIYVELRWGEGWRRERADRLRRREEAKARGDLEQGEAVADEKR